MHKNEPIEKHTFKITSGDLEQAGEVSSIIRRILKQKGLAGDFVRRICIASYEVEINMVIHSFGGEIEMLIYPDEIAIIAQDHGPGIPDIALALEDGYSTASEKVLRQGFGAGRGLSNIKRCSDKFEINSEIGKGTIIKLFFYCKEHIL